ncbi:MAG: hypothetical protein KJ970_13330 [Candidatus Eisenbacteria bacterium]|uniref:Uncharacterized protein n=1 Tax=Eiseniibacteriota bacterium TaxID=2212470 RepID=A0A948RWQ7_UNCEI|nr:hypothetical protein [Candidatus Eisenbacteria bacterium]MBU1947898.1 hypothetical protein [Candidatus Eisenbacteria bacterium]MBU2691896.1 hypothetical protein [Candidatus Eisenbacteria bacterium]
MKLIAVLLIALVLFMAVLPVAALDCSSLPHGWEYVPGLLRICLMLELFEQRGLDPDCNGWD